MFYNVKDVNGTIFDGMLNSKLILLFFRF